MPQRNQGNVSSDSVPIGIKIEELNNKIDGYNRELEFSGNSDIKFELIEEIKFLHKEVKRMNMKLFSKI
jgi:hypothetical protein